MSKRHNVRVKYSHSVSVKYMSQRHNVRVKNSESET